MEEVVQGGGISLVVIGGLGVLDTTGEDIDEGGLDIINEMITEESLDR